MDKLATASALAQASKRRLRRDGRRATADGDVVKATLNAMEARLPTKNPMRVVPDAEGFSSLSKNEIKKDTKEIEKHTNFMVAVESESEDEFDDSFITKSINPSCNVDSTLHKKRRRFLSWNAHPQLIAPDLQKYKLAADRARQELESLQADEERWARCFDLARLQLGSSLSVCQRENDRLQLDAERLYELSVVECGPGVRKRRNLHMRDILEELDFRQEQLESVLEEYCEVAKKACSSSSSSSSPSSSSLAVGAAAAPVVEVTLEELDYAEDAVCSRFPLPLDGNMAASKAVDVSVKGCEISKTSRDQRRTRDIDKSNHPEEDEDSVGGVSPRNGDASSEFLSLFGALDGSIRLSEAAVGNMDPFFPDDDVCDDGSYSLVATLAVSQNINGKKPLLPSVTTTAAAVAAAVTTVADKTVTGDIGKISDSELATQPRSQATDKGQPLISKPVGDAAAATATPMPPSSSSTTTTVPPSSSTAPMPPSSSTAPMPPSSSTAPMPPSSSTAPMPPSSSTIPAAITSTTVSRTDKARELEQKLAGPFAVGRSEAEWVQIVTTACQDSDPAVGVGAGALPSRKKRGNGTTTVDVASFVFHRTPRDVPLLVTPLSQFEDRYLGAVAGPAPHNTSADVLAADGYLPAELVSAENDAILRCRLQSLAAQAQTKIARLRTRNADLLRQRGDAGLSLRKAQGLFSQARRDTVLETKWHRRELYMYGLLARKETDPPLSPIEDYTSLLVALNKGSSHRQGTAHRSSGGGGGGGGAAKRSNKSHHHKGTSSAMGALVSFASALSSSPLTVPGAGNARNDLRPSSRMSGGIAGSAVLTDLDTDAADSELDMDADGDGDGDADGVKSESAFGEGDDDSADGSGSDRGVDDVDAEDSEAWSAHGGATAGAAAGLGQTQVASGLTRRSSQAAVQAAARLAAAAEAALQSSQGQEEPGMGRRRSSKGASAAVAAVIANNNSSRASSRKPPSGARRR